MLFNIEELRIRGYVSIPFSVGDSYLRKAADSFIRLTSLPEELLQTYSFTVQDGPRPNIIGYTRTQKRAGDNEDKAYFHYNPNFLRMLGPGIFCMDPCLAEFLDYAGSIYTESIWALKAVLSELEKRYPKITEVFFPTHAEGKSPLFMLRFLKYYPASNDNAIAVAHYDRGALTLAICESQEGLRIGLTENLELVEHQDRKAFLFCGWKMPKVQASRGELIPAWHDAIQVGELLEGKDHVRWAIVFFAHPQGVETSVYDDHHTFRASFA